MIILIECILLNKLQFILSLLFSQQCANMQGCHNYHNLRDVETLDSDLKITRQHPVAQAAQALRLGLGIYDFTQNICLHGSPYSADLKKKKNWCGTFCFFLLFLFLFIFSFWLHHAACEILVPNQGLNLCPLHRKC